MTLLENAHIIRYTPLSTSVRNPFGAPRGRFSSGEPRISLIYMSRTLRLMARKKGGQPRQYSPATVRAIIDKFARYIDRTDVPIIVEFCYRNHVSRKCIYEYPEFDEVRERCLMKKEAQLERLGGNKLWDPGMAKFSLTQMGWSNKQDIAHSGNIDSNVHIYLPSNNRLSKPAPKEDDE